MTFWQNVADFGAGCIVGAVLTGAITTVAAPPAKPCVPAVVYAHVHAVDKPGGGFTLEPVCPSGYREGPPPSMLLSSGSSHAAAINGIQTMQCLPIR